MHGGRGGGENTLRARDLKCPSPQSFLSPLLASNCQILRSTTGQGAVVLQDFKLLPLINIINKSAIININSECICNYIQK
jgi:hypothetical protein